MAVIENLVITGVLFYYINIFGLNTFSLSEISGDNKFGANFGIFVRLLDNIFFFILTLNIMVIYYRLGVEETVNVDDQAADLMDDQPTYDLNKLVD